MKRVTVVLLLLLSLGCTKNTVLQTPTMPDEPTPTTISGGWQGIVSSSNVANAVWTMTLTQEQTVAFGNWVDDVNDYRGDASIAVTPDNLIIGTITIRTIASCTNSVTTCGACVGRATVRGTVSDDEMDWQSEGWSECPGTPIQVEMSWERQ